MKKNFILLPLITLLGYALLTSYQAGPGLSGSLERTGASGTLGCSVGGCHSGSGGLAVTAELLSGGSPVTTYTPGASYTVRLSGTYTATSAVLLPKFGFQVACTKVGASPIVNAGTWGTLPAFTHSATVSSVNIVEQGPALSATTGSGGSGTTYVIDIPWTAPVAGTGSVKIWGVINAVNGNSSIDASDRWKDGNITITEAVSSGPGAITGTLSVCAGANTTLNCTPAGGTWSSSNTTVGTVGASSGVVTGIMAGTTTIQYTTGVGTPSTVVVTVNPSPTAITGTFTLCVGATTTLTSTPAAGTWICSPATVATVNATTGAVTGIGAGTASVAYALGSCSVSSTVTVSAVGAGPISGSNTVCVGLTTALTNPTPGGTWASSAPTKATVSTAGVVTGVAVGTANITYTATNTCGTSFKVHSVNVLSATSCPTGVVPVSVMEDELQVYPNPASGVFNLRMQSAVGELANVVITNIAGQKIKELYVQTNNSTEVRMPSAPGIYFVSVTTSQGNYVTKLLIQ